MVRKKKRPNSRVGRPIGKSGTEAETLENESDRQQIVVQEEAELHHAWRMAKCRAVPKAALGPLRELRPPSVYTPSPVDQRDQLVAAAARLGSEWALAVGNSLSRAGSHGNVAVETSRDLPLALAYLHWSHHAGPAYLLAARQADLANDAPRFDWRGWERGLEEAHGAARVAAAASTVTTIRTHGWPPRNARELGNSPWPWSDLPTPVRTNVVRRRIDESGNVRWVHQNGLEKWWRTTSRTRRCLAAKHRPPTTLALAAPYCAAGSMTKVPNDGLTSGATSTGSKRMEQSIGSNWTARSGSCCRLGGQATRGHHDKATARPRPLGWAYAAEAHRPPLVGIEDAGHERQTSGDAPAGELPTRTVLGRAC